MSDYIDRAALGIDFCRWNVFENKSYADGWNAAVKILMKAPTVDVQEVRHGEWKSFHSEDTLYGSYYCSACGHEQDIGMVVSLTTEFKYCPNCGAKMDGGKNNA